MTLTDTDTRADLEQALLHLSATAQRMPEHWVDKRAAVHQQIDAVLDRLQLLDH